MQKKNENCSSYVKVICEAKKNEEFSRRVMWKAEKMMRNENLKRLNIDRDLCFVMEVCEVKDFDSVWFKDQFYCSIRWRKKCSKVFGSTKDEFPWTFLNISWVSMNLLFTYVHLEWPMTMNFLELKWHFLNLSYISMNFLYINHLFLYTWRHQTKTKA